MFLNFFMDDFYFLTISQANNFRGFINLFKPIKFTPYRPISQQLFFWSFEKLFGLDPIPYHFFIFFTHLLNSFLVYQISFAINKNKSRSKLISLMYLISAIHFVGLYSITGSYIIFGVFYILLSFWFWLRFRENKNKWSYILSLISFCLAMFSAEIAFSLPFIFLLLNKNSKKLLTTIPFILIIIINLLINSFWAGAPKTNAFAFNFSTLPSTFRWYILRVLSLPEGVKNGYLWEKETIYLSFLSLIIIIFVGLIKNLSYLLKIKKELLKYILWIFISGLPFYFMPYHLNPIYFSLGLIGFLLLINKILNLKLLYLYTFLFMLASFISFQLLLHTHWTVRRANLAKTWSSKISRNCSQVKEDKLVFPISNQSEKDELEIALGFGRGPRLICHNPKLEVIFTIPKNE